jgi:hypothetical protein
LSPKRLATDADTASTPQQEAAADLLVTGKTVISPVCDTYTAEVIAVTRQTVSECLAPRLAERVLDYGLLNWVMDKTR